jgi:hypothetical protein
MIDANANRKLCIALRVNETDRLSTDSEWRRIERGAQ